MEAAALYAMARVLQKDVICFAQVTNQMGQTEGDFEKGQEQGSMTALHVLRLTARAWQANEP
jgi:purine-nucleoside phosphorylase